MAASGHRKAMPASSMASSMCWPSAEPRSRANSAAVMAWAAVYAVALSQIRVRKTAGSPVAGLVCTPA